MKDEHDSKTFDLADILGEAADNGSLRVSQRYALVGHYQAVLPPDKALKVTGARWLGSSTPDVARNSWRTPKWLFNYLSKLAGGFDIDAAADEYNALCPVYFSEKNSAFDNQCAAGQKVWLNPPYSDPLPWVQWAVDQVLDNGCTIYLLLPDDVSTEWFRLAWDNAAEGMPMLHNGMKKREGGKSGRVRFVNALTGEEGGSNNKGSWVFVLRRHRSPIKITGLDRTICEAEGDSFF